MAKVVLIDPLGFGKRLPGHRHFVRDWTGGWIPGFIAFPPLDLMCAAAYLRKLGHDVRILEASSGHVTHRKVAALVKDMRPEYCFIPTTFFTLDDDRYLAGLIKDSSPGLKMIFGGPNVTYDPSLALCDDSIDFVALGEFELPLRDIMGGKYSENIARRDNGKIVRGERSLLDLSELPVPARDLVNNDVYRFAIFNRRNPVTAMAISRGCPHNKCEFCHSSLYTLGEIRYRTMDSISEEIQEIAYRYRIGEIFFRDQTFTANRELVWNMCEYILSRGIDIFWRASTRVDLVDKELLAFMRKAGCFQIAYGFESCSQNALDLNNKGITLDQSRQAAHWAKQAGMEVSGLFVCGMLGDTQRSLMSLGKFAAELDLDFANFKSFHVVPGTPFYEKHGERYAEKLFSGKWTRICTALNFLNFYLRPKFLCKQFSRIRSWEELSFLVKAGLHELIFNL